MRLTGANVARLQLPDGKSEHMVFDDSLKGFGVRLRAGGKRVWIAQYRIGRKQSRVTIGAVEALSADEARNTARKILAKAHLGTDAQAEKARARARASITVAAIAKDFLKWKADRMKPRSYDEVHRHLNVHWKPLGDRPAHDLTRAEVAKRLNEIAREHGPFASNRARASLSSLLSWAMREGLVDANPVAATNRFTDEKSRDRVLSDDELRAVWLVCGDDDYGRIVRLLILTGQRREEVGGLQWPELDLDKGLWSLPASRSKNSRPHDVPLSSAAIDILKAVPRREKRALVFGSGEGPFSGWSRAKAALDQRAAKILHSGDDSEDIPPMTPWRLHDIRRTVATRLHDLGVLPHVVEAILNHVSGHKAGVAGVYNRATYAAEKRAALDMWADTVAKLCAQETGNDE